MTRHELWQYFSERAIASSRPFDRTFLWVEHEAFDAVRHEFVREFNIIHAGESFRSHTYIRHIHAVKQESCMFIHQDTGNIARFFPLGIMHFFCDVLPYLAIAAYRRTSIAALFVRPREVYRSDQKGYNGTLI